MAKLAAGIHILGIESDMYLLALAGRRVETVQIPGVLIDNRPAVRARELDIIVGISGHFLRSPGLCIIGKYIHRLVPVGDEEDFVPDPHRDDVLGHIVSDVLYLLRGRVVNPDVVRHAATVIFPCTELAEHPVVGHSLPVRRKAAEPAFRQGQAFRHSALRGYFPELARKPVPDAVPVDHLPVRGPGQHHIVGTHAVAHVITRVGGSPAQAARLSAFRRDNIDLTVAVILAGKGNIFSVRRIARKNLIPDM